MDEYVEKVLIPEYTRGRVRKPNRAFHRVWAAMGSARRHGDRAKVRELRKQLHSMPSIDTRDPGYRRLRYVRYCDDTLLGFAGPKAEAEEIKERLAQFLRDELKLELSPEKTLITHARTGAARFLGYDITVHHNDSKISGRRRSVNGTIGLRVPRSVVVAKQAQYMKRGKPARRPQLLNQDDHVIISTYGSEYRGIVQYYLAGRRRLSTRPAAMGHVGLDVDDAGQQAPFVVLEDGPQVRGHHRDTVRTAQVLRGPR